MSESESEVALPTQQYGRFYKHPPDGRLKDFPYPKLGPNRVRIRSPVSLSVRPYQVHVAFSRGDANAFRGLPSTTFHLGDGDPESLVPHFTLGAAYVEFFNRLATKSGPQADEKHGVTFLEPIPAGVWLLFCPKTSDASHGILSVTDGQGRSRVYLFPSKGSGWRLLLTLQDLFHGDIPRDIDLSALPRESENRLVTIEGQLADWITAHALLTQP